MVAAAFLNGYPNGELIRRIAAGDEDACTAFYERLSRWGRYILYRKGARSDAVEDIIHSTYEEVVKVAKKVVAGKYPAIEKFSGFVRQVLLNTKADLWKKDTKSGKNVELDEARDKVNGNKSQFEAVATKEELKLFYFKLNRVLRGFDDFEIGLIRAIIYREEESIKEVADRLGFSVEATRVIWAKFIRKARIEYDEDGWL